MAILNRLIRPFFIPMKTKSIQVLTQERLSNWIRSRYNFPVPETSSKSTQNVASRFLGPPKTKGSEIAAICKLDNVVNRLLDTVSPTISASTVATIGAYLKMILRSPNLRESRV